jgi:hypothetical protein
MSNPVTGLTTFAQSGAPANLVATCNGGVSKFNSATSTLYTGATIDLNSLTFMQQCVNPDFAADQTLSPVAIYGTDKVNPVFKFDGATLTAPTILAADGITPMAGVSDLLYFFDRMWYAIDDYIYFSEVGLPQTILSAQLQVRRGAGDKIVRLMSYRNAYILVFKGGTGGIGSIHVLDVSSNDPTYFSAQPQPLYDNISIESPHSMARLAANQSADILFMTTEGMRSLNFTSLDQLTSPSLPITDNIPTIISSINKTKTAGIHATVFDDEILLWLPTDTNATPDLCMGNNRKIPGNSPLQGWVKYDMMPATCSVIASLNSNDGRSLYIGTADGTVQRAFADPDGTHLYTEIGKRIDYGVYDKDKTPLKLFLDQDLGAKGDMECSMLFEDSEERFLGEQVFGVGGFDIPFAIPFDLPDGAIETEIRDLHLDGDGIQMRRAKDMRFKLVTDGFPRILGYMLQSFIEQYRYNRLETDESAAPRSANYAPPAIEPTNYTG